MAADKEENAEPSEALQDKVHFIFNNMSTSNLEQKVYRFFVYIKMSTNLCFSSVKVEEFRDVVDKEYYAWVSQYLVMKRVSIEPNFHVLYMNFLDTLSEKQMFTSVLKETHRNIKVCCNH